MRICFDHQIFYLQRYGGISRYFIELASALNELNKGIAQIIAPYHKNELLAEKEKTLLQTALKKPLVHPLVRFEPQANASALVKALKEEQKTILHETYYTLRTKVSAPKVITVHDMIPELFDGDKASAQTLIAGKKAAIEEAAAIICVSESTRKDLTRFYPAAASRCHVVHHGVIQPLGVHGNRITPRPYILHVGNRGGYKNFEELLETYVREKEIHGLFDLVVFGGGAESEKEKKLKPAHLNPHIYYLEGDDQQLFSLYKNASVLVYISAYEGFGLPLLEAMASKCPVICSDAAVMKEVAGDAALFVNPGKSQLLPALKSVLLDDQIGRVLVDKGLQRVKEFTWRRCATQTLQIYKSVLGVV